MCRTSGPVDLQRQNSRKSGETNSFVKRHMVALAIAGAVCDTFVSKKKHDAQG